MKASVRSRRHRRHRDHEPLLLRRARSTVKQALRSVAPAPARPSGGPCSCSGASGPGRRCSSGASSTAPVRVVTLEEHDRTARAGQRPGTSPLGQPGSRLLPHDGVAIRTLIVAKPLVESHQGPENSWTASTGREGIWMLGATISPVATSNLRRFGADNGYRGPAPPRRQRGPATGGVPPPSEVRDRVRSPPGIRPVAPRRRRGVLVGAESALYWTKNCGTITV